MIALEGRVGSLGGELLPPPTSLTLRALCPLCSKENFDSIPDLEFNPIRGKIVHAFFDKR